MTQLKKSISILVLAFAILSFTSCGEVDDIAVVLSNSDAAEIIEAALQDKAGAFVTNVQDMTQQIVDAVESGALCDTIYTDSIQKNHQGTQIQADYTSSLTFECACNMLDNVQTATFSMLTNTEFTTPKIDTDGNGNFTGTMDGLALNSQNITIDGSYVLTSTQLLDFKEQETINSTLTLTLVNLEIKKTTQSIQSGSGTFTLAGSTTKENFSFSGSIVFNGNKTATLTIGSDTYPLDWN